jgi:hypothetical protein
VADRAKVEALLARLAKDRLGAAEKGLENANGIALDVWRLGPGEPALLAATVVEGLALVSAGPGGPEALRTALKLDPALSLAQSSVWQRARAALGEEAALLFWLPPGAPALEGAPASDGVIAGLSASAGSARLVAAALLGWQEGRLRPLAGTGAGRTDPSPLDPATVLAARLSASLGATLALLGDRTDDPKLAALRGLAELLEPPLDVGLSLSPRAELGALLGTRGRLDPLRVVRAELVAHLKAGASPGPALAALAKAAQAEGPGRPGKPGRWRVATGDGSEIAWAVTGQTLHLAAGPSGALEALQARSGAGFQPPGKGGAQALAGGLGGAVLHLDNLMSAVQSLPPEAFGTGPDAFEARAMVARLTAPGGRHAAISLRADLPAGALRLALEVELGEPPSAP